MRRRWLRLALHGFGCPMLALAGVEHVPQIEAPALYDPRLFDVHDAIR